MPVPLTITSAGLDALVDAQTGTTDAVRITAVGLTAATFDAAPTLTALPGETRRLDAVSGQSVSASVIHVTAQDPSADTYDVRGLALYTDGGVLFAAYGQADPIFTKVSPATFLLALDVAFTGDVSDNIVFGDASFLLPPASETVKGVAELATQAEVDAGTDDARVVTPKKLDARLSALLGAINTTIAGVAASLAALVGRTVTGAGLVTGGGDLSASRVLTVTEASAADVAAGTSATTVITPRRLGPVSMLLAQNGFIRFFGFQIAWGRFNALPNARTNVAFAQPFQTACFAVVVSPSGESMDTDSKDNTATLMASTITTGGFAAFSADEDANVTCFIAVGT